MTAVIDNYDEALDPAQRYAQAYDGSLSSLCLFLFA